MPPDEPLMTSELPFHPPRPGPAYLSGYRLMQCDSRTCGPAVVVVARAMMDPLFAGALAAGGPDAFVRAQHAAHRSANVLWPRALGTTPWGAAAALSLHNGQYGWRSLRSPDSAGVALAQAVQAVTRGFPVPLLIGNWIPRHWVLLVGRDGSNVLCYDPAAGSVLTLPVDDLIAGRLPGLGFGRPQAVVLPERLPA